MEIDRIEDLEQGDDAEMVDVSKKRLLWKYNQPLKKKELRWTLVQLIVSLK